MKIFVIAGLLALAPGVPGASAQNSPADSGRFTQDEIRTFLDYCSEEANARGLNVEDGYAEARKAFRRECMHRLGVDPNR